jgi:integrase
MPRTKLTHPAYCRHKRSGIGYVTIDGKQRPLPGKYNSRESREAYDALIGQWLGNGRALPAEPVTGVTVSTIALAFWKHAQAFYKHPDGTPTGEAGNYRPALRALRKVYGAMAAASFGPKTLRSLRTAMLLPQDGTDPTPKKTIRRPGWSRTYANRQVERIKAIFRWAASEEMIPAGVPPALSTLDAIRAGRDGARETKPVEPVAVELVDATLPHLPPPVAAMVQLQRLTGARGGELFKLRAADIDMSGPVWKFRPARHKTAHKGYHRTIRFGPQARQILEPFLITDLIAYLFRPADAIAWRNDRARANAKTPLRDKPRRLRTVRSHYTKDTYARAVARACDSAGVARWHPHQLRHTAGSVYRREGDFETAKIVLGHASDSMTQLYAERDERKADEVVARIG